MARGQKHYTDEFKNTTITAEEYKNLLKKNAKLEEEIEILKKEYTAVLVIFHHKNVKI